jgi:hypothetical protein
MGLKRQALRQTVDIMVRISGKDVARSLQATAARIYVAYGAVKIVCNAYVPAVCFMHIFNADGVPVT